MARISKFRNLKWVNVKNLKSFYGIYPHKITTLAGVLFLYKEWIEIQNQNQHEPEPQFEPELELQQALEPESEPELQPEPA